MVSSGGPQLREKRSGKKADRTAVPAAGTGAGPWRDAVPTGARAQRTASRLASQETSSEGHEDGRLAGAVRCSQAQWDLSGTAGQRLKL